MSLLQYLNADNWNRNGFSGADAQGCAVSHTHDEACKFCIMGAYWKYISPVNSSTIEDDSKRHELATIIKEHYPSDKYFYAYSEKYRSDSKVIFIFNDEVAESFEDVKKVLTLAGW